ncbi:tetratricopeptide repeat protein [Micromonospora sp. CPCC 206060]|uniref:tetratricopeptide repeat protein n=1 Tax=Micromonospora sp. CPCC 206060 TaxID=3122406 RepID=UPI002FF2D55E
MTATKLLAPLAAQTGQTHLAIATYEEAITAATRAFGEEHAQMLRARAAHAVLRHRLGDCDTALRNLAAVQATAAHRHGHHSRLSLRTLIDLGSLYRDCGHHDLAARCPTTASTGIDRYLPPDDPLREVITAVIAAPASLDHLAVCTQPQPRSQ